MAVTFIAIFGAIVFLLRPAYVLLPKGAARGEPVRCKHGRTTAAGGGPLQRTRAAAPTAKPEQSSTLIQG
jgi:hypothetical protein